MNVGFIICMSVCGLFMLVQAFVAGLCAGVKSEQKDAIKAGAGRYVADEKTGKVKFVYGSKMCQWENDK